MNLDNERVQKKKATLRLFNKIYSLCLSVIIAVTGICFIAAACHLYFTGGEMPYSRERVGIYLRAIIVPIILTIAATVAGGIISLMIDISEKRSGAKTDPVIMQKALSRVFDASASPSVLHERKKRKLIALVTTIGSAVLFGVSCVLAILIPEHAVDGLNGHIALAVLIITPSVLIIIAAIYTAMRLCAHSSECEALLIKEEIKLDPSKRCSQKITELLTTRRLLIIRLSVLSVAVLFIILGIFNGGMKDVLDKATAICTECIGLG